MSMPGLSGEPVLRPGGEPAVSSVVDGPLTFHRLVVVGNDQPLEAGLDAIMRLMDQSQLYATLECDGQASVPVGTHFNRNPLIHQVGKAAAIGSVPMSPFQPAQTMRDAGRELMSQLASGNGPAVQPPMFPQQQQLQPQLPQQGVPAPAPPQPQPQQPPPPRRRVMFSIEQLGQHTVSYHEVVIQGPFLVLVFDTRWQYSDMYIPPAGPQVPPILMAVDGSDQIYLVAPTGVDFVYDHLRFCVLRVVASGTAEEWRQAPTQSQPVQEAQEPPQQDVEQAS